VIWHLPAVTWHLPAPPPPSSLALARQGRWRLNIPGIGVGTRLLVLGDPHGNVLSVQTLAQASEAAWYDFSAVPGTPGNAVLVGHVDTYTGPGVFYNLYRLRPGDPIYVGTGGRRLRFAVRKVTEVPKHLFPVNQVFGTTNSRHLWIITCGGSFDYRTRHYLDNIIVLASYQPTRRRQHH
jgi:sortase (surface protein transpeptidase)